MHIPTTMAISNGGYSANNEMNVYKTNKCVKMKRSAKNPATAHSPTVIHN